MKRALIFSLIVSMLVLAACASPTPAPTPAPTAPPAPTSAPAATATQPVVGGISNSTIKMVYDPSSGPECSGTAAYLVTLAVSASGSTSAQYVVDATDGSGQVPNGVFDTFDKPEVTDALTFNGAETKTIKLKLKGPFSYADSVTVRAKVNGKNLDAVTQPCAPASGSAATATSAPVQACDSAQFIADVTVPDNTVLKPGEIFTKTWRLKNTGTCTWDASYTVNADSGPGMSQNSVYLLSKSSNKSTVAPGDTVDISIDMQASSTPGNYQTFWRLQNGAGSVVPVAGGASGKLFFVQIIVNAPGSAPAATATPAAASGGSSKISQVTVEMVQEQGSGAVCAAGTTYFVYVDVSTDGPMTANYRVDATDDSGQVGDGVFDGYGNSEANGQLVFSAAGKLRASLHLLGPYSYPKVITIRVKVNDQDWKGVTVSCK